MADKTLSEIAYEAYDTALPFDVAWQAVADAVIAEYERRRWRAISEAPKDRKILLAGPHDSGETYQEVSQWYVLKSHTDQGRWPVAFMSGFGEPTHFTTLPAPPKEGE